MKFSTRHDTPLDADTLFDRVTDFDQVGRLLRQRGAAVRRVDPAAEPGEGMAWDIVFDLRGRRRDLRLKVVAFDRPDSVIIEGASDLFDVTIGQTVVALSAQKSRLIFELELRPRNIRARLMLQTAKLGKTQLDRGFAARIASYADKLTARR